jgi:hypothetical protein
MLKARRKAAGRRITVGEDKAYDTADHVAALPKLKITPHVARNDAETKKIGLAIEELDQLLPLRNTLPASISQYFHDLLPQPFVPGIVAAALMPVDGVLRLR